MCLFLLIGLKIESEFEEKANRQFIREALGTVGLLDREARQHRPAAPPTPHGRWLQSILTPLDSSRIFLIICKLMSPARPDKA